MLDLHGRWCLSASSINDESAADSKVVVADSATIQKCTFGHDNLGARNGMDAGLQFDFVDGGFGLCNVARTHPHGLFGGDIFNATLLVAHDFASQLVHHQKDHGRA